MAWTTVEGWGGRVWVGSDGKKRTFYIRQFRDGKRYDVSTKCSTLRGALAELGRFETALANGEEYRPAGGGSELVLDEPLIESYVTWCREKTKATDPRWLTQKRRALTWWKEYLDERPLHTVTLTRIHDGLKKDGGNERDRVVAIKHLYTFLRRTDRISASDDPTLDALVVPQSRPEQDTTGVSKVITEADFRAVLLHLEPVHADLCRFMAGTGAHLSEALRFMAAGKVEDGPGLPVIEFRHKGGKTHRQQVPGPVAEAAKRLLATKAPARETVYRAIKRACTKASVEVWTPGRFRHTFATTAIERGVPPEAVALQLGHTGKLTTLVWYATRAAAPRVNGGYVG